MSGPRKEAQVHSFSLHPQRATSAQSEPNYRAVGRAVPTDSQQKAVANTRRKLLCWHLSLSPLSSTTREEGLTPQTAAGSHRSSTGQTRPLPSVPNPTVPSPAERGEGLLPSPGAAPLLHTPQQHIRGCCSPEASLTPPTKPLVPVELQFLSEGRDKQLPTHPGSHRAWALQQWPGLRVGHTPGGTSQSTGVLLQHSSSQLLLARKSTGRGGGQGETAPEHSQAQVQQRCLLAAALRHCVFQPSGAGGGGKILIVHEHNPHVIPIDPLSHSRINSFDNTRAAQEL